MSKDKKPQCPFIQRFAEDLSSPVRPTEPCKRTVEHFVNSASTWDMIPIKPAKRTSATTCCSSPKRRSGFQHSQRGSASPQAQLSPHLSTRLGDPETRSRQSRTEASCGDLDQRGADASQTDRKTIDAVLLHTVVYHLGLRLNEALHLQISDIDSKRMMVHISSRQGSQGSQDSTT